MNDSRYTVQSAAITRAGVQVFWADGHTSLYDHMWLRDNCVCERCGTHASGSRFQLLLDIPDDITAGSVDAGARGLAVTWAESEHVSEFDIRWLRDHCYCDAERTYRHRPRMLWDHSLRELPRVDYQSATVDDAERFRLFSSVYDYGFVLVEHVGTAHDEIERLAQTIGYIRETHYGRVFDLKVRPNPQLLADTPRAILPHTDETYRHVPTGVNIFHCIQPSPDGGGISTLVDSFTVAAHLKAQDAEAFALLSRVPVRHERRIAGQTIRSDHPVFTLDYDGDVAEVRLNERTMTALSVPEHLMAPTYRALRQVLRIAYDPANLVQHRLVAGEALVFDNLRVLHGRTSFAGERFLRQTQVMRDEFYAKLLALDEARLSA